MVITDGQTELAQWYSNRHNQHNQQEDCGGNKGQLGHVRDELSDRMNYYLPPHHPVIVDMDRGGGVTRRMIAMNDNQMSVTIKLIRQCGI